jgi:hypothetical protein
MNRRKYLKCECQHCGGHIEFPAETIGTFAPCPHCQQETELVLPRPPEEPAFSRKALILSLGAIIMMILALVVTMLGLGHYKKLLAQRRAAAASVAPMPVATNLPAAAALAEEGTVQSDFRVSRINVDKTAGTSLVYAVGTVKNLLDKQRFGVKVEVDLYNVAGQKIGSARDYQQLLEPGGEWKFKALVVEPKASSAQLSSIQEQQ